MFILADDRVYEATSFPSVLSMPTLMKELCPGWPRRWTATRPRRPSRRWGARGGRRPAASPRSAGRERSPARGRLQSPGSCSSSESRSMPTATTARQQLVGDLDERADQGGGGGRRLDALPAVAGQLGDGRAWSASRHASDSGAGGQGVERDHGAVLAVGGGALVQELAIGVALGLHELEADPRGRRRGGRRAARRCAASSRRRATPRGSSLTNSSSPSRQERQPDLERRGASAEVEGEQGVVGLGGREELARRAPRPFPAGRGSAPRGRRRAPGAEVDDRLEDRGHLPLGEELGNQSVRTRSSSVVGRQRQSRLVAEPDREHRRALADAQPGDGPSAGGPPSPGRPS